MHNIKFRAWDEESETMYYSDKCWENAEATFVCESEGILKCYVPETIDATRDEPEHIVGRELSDIMQFTGLKDKNGKESYAGDLVDVKDGDYEAKGVVEWSGESGLWVWRATDTHNSMTIATGQGIPLWKILGKQYRYQGEIIGTIHTHPNLIEGDK